MRILFFILICFRSAIVTAQVDTSKKLSFSGFAEIYYSYDFNKPSNHEKPGFLYNHKRHNELNANLILAQAAYNNKSIRANLGLMAGTYAQYNLSAEPDWAQFIYEATIGLKLSKNIWIDAGIMPSHIGFEGIISNDDYTLTRGILAENQPYYQTGLKLGYASKNDKLNLAFYILNGWQKIRRPDYIQTPSFGMQVNYKPGNTLTLNYSNFLGTDKPDSLHTFRTYHNFYLQYEPNKKLGVIAGFDVGTDKYKDKKYGLWFAPTLIVKHAVNNKSNIALRAEYYNDNKQIIVQTNTQHGFAIYGFSSNFDYIINSNALWRIEAKTYRAKDNIFNNKKDNYCITTSLSIKL